MVRRTFPVLLAGTLLLAGGGNAGASAALTRLQQAYGRASATEAYNYALWVRIALLVAFQDGGQRPLSLTRCDDERLEIFATLRFNRVESCSASIRSEDDYHAEVRFSGGLAFEIDQNGVRPLDPAPSAPKSGK
ncbi:hypothetical protein [Deinococcus gobiensis]|uniref:Uncharacterized protein n=1 Tax=Deinococcus gobiensis (strain DSM 21396 / JCM 16679 / CGMCC 1.7299 / I-0) TaxID=745776 RepID=H8GY69_DEIGI|nr:hypothetical protein [Deinococcus gobiensis]AFD25997.1 hypothetical protein DGo_CA2070 [Deinococcus gobiensis I-0]